MNHGQTEVGISCPLACCFWLQGGLLDSTFRSKHYVASDCLILYLDSVSLKNGGLFNKIVFLNSDVIWKSGDSGCE